MIAVSTVRLPPSRRPRARPGVIVWMRSSTWTMPSRSSTGFDSSGASASKRTAAMCSIENGVQVETPTGPWNVTRPVRAWIASRSAVTSL